MTMPGRTYPAPCSVNDGYPYSHNGQEKDNEIFSGALTAEYWEYDSRTGRRWERDPITYEGESPYACFSNNPILLNDPQGLADKTKGPKKKFSTKKRVYKPGQHKDGGKKGDTKGKGKDNGKSNDKKGDKSGDKTPTEKQKDNKKLPPIDDHKVIGFHEKNPNYKIFYEASRNEKTNGRKDHFEFFTHARSDGFQYVNNGKIDHGYDADAFDRMMKANSPDWKKMRENHEKITITLYGCNMASHKYLKHDNKTFKETYFTIAQQISMLDNVTVIAATGYVQYLVVAGKAKIVNISNYRNDGKFIKIVQGKESPVENNSKPILP